MTIPRKVLFFVGSTASGKSEWALDYAESVGGVIFNCDSVQVYKDLVIGSASPTVAEKKRVPHKLYNYIEYPQEMSLGQYYRNFFTEFDQLKKGKPLLVVGGTGFYFQALEKGLLEIPPIPSHIRYEVLEQLKSPEKTDQLYAEILKADPESAKHIHIRDHYRIGRALEVLRAHGKTPRQFQCEHSGPARPLEIHKVAIHYDKSEMLRRVDGRASRMITGGLIDEVQGIRQKYPCEDWAPLQSIGYRETMDYLDGTLAFEDLLPRITQNTMKLIKKQRTWFQRDHLIRWYQPSEKSLFFQEITSVMRMRSFSFPDLS